MVARAVGPPASRSMTMSSRRQYDMKNVTPANATTARLDRPDGASLFTDSSTHTITWTTTAPPHLREGRLPGPHGRGGLFRHSDVSDSNHLVPQAISQKATAGSIWRSRAAAHSIATSSYTNGFFTLSIPLLARPATTALAPGLALWKLLHHACLLVDHNLCYRRNRLCHKHIEATALRLLPEFRLSYVRYGNASQRSGSPAHGARNSDTEKLSRPVDRGFQATSVPACSLPSEGGCGGVMSVGRSSSLPLWKTAPARTRATRWGALTARHRACAASISL